MHVEAHCSDVLLAQVPDAQWEGFYKPLWLAAAFVNSGYSYFWDVERDWDIQWFTARSGELLLSGVNLPCSLPAVPYSCVYNAPYDVA